VSYLVSRLTKVLPGITLLVVPAWVFQLRILHTTPPRMNVCDTCMATCSTSTLDAQNNRHDLCEGWLSYLASSSGCFKNVPRERKRVASSSGSFD
jgi:hypothetical protein